MKTRPSWHIQTWGRVARFGFSSQPSARHVQQTRHDAYGYNSMFDFIRHDLIVRRESL